MSGHSFRVGFLMDKYESLNLATETSLLCMDELLNRGHQVFWLEQAQLSLAGHGLCANLSKVRTTRPFVLDASAAVDINTLDALLIRKDPPFDKSYLHLTYLLDFLPDKVTQINSPVGLRNLNEKLYTLNWPDYCPDTLISLDTATLVKFVQRHKKVVLKPLDDCSGRGIQFVHHDEKNLSHRIQQMLDTRGYVLAQQFLDGIRNGDKRVFLLNGKAIGWVDRIPAPGSDLANIHQGATCRASTLSVRERHICDRVGEELVRQDILLAGLDFIDERLTEINITSPSAVRQINEVNGSNLERIIVDGIICAIEARWISQVYSL